jgi:hypothetical protein
VASIFRSNNKQVASTVCSYSYLLHAGLLHGLFFGPENGGYMLLRNAGLHHKAGIDQKIPFRCVRTFILTILPIVS